MKSVIRFLTGMALCASLLIAAAGCSGYWYRSPEYVVVDRSALNYVQIFYQASETAPRVRCLMRDGNIILLVGHSVTVGDDFNIDYRKRAFGDIKEHTLSLGPDSFRDTLQTLVNAGILRYSRPDSDAPVYPKVLVKCNINHCVRDQFVYDETLIAEIEAQLTRYRLAGQQL